MLPRAAWSRQIIVLYVIGYVLQITVLFVFFFGLASCIFTGWLPGEASLERLPCPALPCLPEVSRLRLRLTRVCEKTLLQRRTPSGR